MFRRQEAWKAALIVSCIADPYKLEKSAWNLRSMASTETASGYLDYVSRQMRVCRYLGRPLKCPCGVCTTIMMVHKVPIEFIKWARLNRPEELTAARNADILAPLFSLLRLWEVQCVQSRTQLTPHNRSNSYTTSRPRQRFPQHRIRAISSAPPRRSDTPTGGKGNKEFPIIVAGRDGVVMDTGNNR